MIGFPMIHPWPVRWVVNMKVRDIVWMATYNLWTRKLRTSLNLLGVMISSLMLLMTFAATRGASDGIMNIINRSAQARQILVIAARNRNVPVPESAIKINDDVSPDRKVRLQSALKAKWLSANAKRVYMDQDILRQIRSIPDLASIVPRQTINAELELADTVTQGSLVGVWVKDATIKDRLIVGNLPLETDLKGVMLDEFTAYKLGYHKRKDLESLVGQPLTARINGSRQRKPSRASQLLRALGPVVGQINLTTLGHFASAVKRLAKDADRSTLTDQEQHALEVGLEKISTLIEPNFDDQKTQDSAASGSSVNSKAKTQKNEHVYVVRGILKRPEKEEDTFGFLQFSGAPRLASVYLNHHAKESLHFSPPGFRGFYSATGEVSRSDRLPEVVREIQALGLDVRSVVAIVEKLESEVGKVRLAIGALALLILLIAALGISNTMIIAVMERTPELGVMKAVGAHDGQVLALVLLEGLITGMIGAAVALVSAVLLSPLAGTLCRKYIEQRLKGTFDQSIFSFAFVDVLIVFVLAGLVCTIASLLPAWRAAKLAPVVAMKK